ncbi:immunoglobulin domain-containing protein [Vibrio parahaemolyticus]|uniref:Ig-like domain-containing protein n=1 Tax=Vibrio parahaemolyticus TaxID=670 RepID=A0A7Z2MVL8_VIBPH|nr:immunoglobulin domain-containing protein [Vibrio parahaemolyticus]HDY7442328.1 immunoglobulin domain-containing protein [Vibrio vulnificus]EJC6864584.1 immunoglobulin domain-containing protein [Vibrio parahaemolyticus]EJC7042193.1 immunoglobulin domain-containing protein [Vibrio parahaemolyticus]MCR9645922.1 immunoglobulin domain-containing protein [Vibrio parahaemolyticus]MCR9726478.1 immunoglobulin domain-containing protein [Vibrio parahaemolyticus]
MRATLRSPAFTAYTGYLGQTKFTNGFSDDIGEMTFKRFKSVLHVEPAYYDPRIQKEMPSSIDVIEGDKVELTVETKGGGCTYTWVKNGATIKGSGSKLVFESVSPDDEGEYVVVVNNPYGTAISSTCSVTVQ